MAAQLAKSCQVLRDAIRAKQSLAAYYCGTVVTFSPHVLGQRPGGPTILTFLLTAEPLLAPEDPRRWRWLEVAQLYGLTVAHAPWRSAPRHTRPPPPDCSVELEAA